MRVIRNRPGQVTAAGGKPSVVTIGNFDGVHRGHQALLQRSAELSGGTSPLVVVSFEPLPQAYFQPHAAPSRLSSVYQKLRLLQAAGVEIVWLMRFDADLAHLAPRAFVEQVLFHGLGAGDVVIGEDFRFGHRRAGEADLLRSLGRELGFEVHALGAVEDDGARVSSTRIRSLLVAGDFAGAARLLGRPYSMEGHVIRGQQLGRSLGYATANLAVRALPCPLSGIFATLTRFCGSGDEAAWLPSVSSLGYRPTFGGGKLLLEVHVFDCDAELYGRRLEVRFVAKLRDEWTFGTAGELVAQMRRDAEGARALLQRNPSLSCPD